MLTAVSLFSGCGGSDLGLRELGVKVLWANDFYRAACDTYKVNMLDTEMVYKNIEKVFAFPSADLLVGCYPCQGFSQGGKRDADAVINLLFIEFYRALKQVRPLAFIIENVVGMLHANNRPSFEAQIEFYNSVGYTPQWKTLDARDFGMGQERKRVFIVGIRNDIGLRYDFPNPTHGSAASLPWITQKDVIGNFPTWPEGEYLDVEMNWYYMSRRRRRDWHECSPCVVGDARAVALHPISPQMEFVKRNEYRFATTDKARRYSVRECMALQGFPADFRLSSDCLRANYKIIGNAVPPPLMKAVAQPLVDVLSL